MIWNIESGSKISTFEGLSSLVTCSSFSPDGSSIASGSWDSNVVKLWNLKTGELLKTLSGHNGSIKSVAFNADGTKLASSSSDGTIRIWNIEPTSVKESTENQENTLSISPNPAGDFITINLDRCPTSSRCWTSGEISIYNTLGEKVMSVGAENFLPLQINISDLLKGLYFVKVGGETSKFIKM